jgi:hypothetical protein
VLLRLEHPLGHSTRGTRILGFALSTGTVILVLPVLSVEHLTRDCQRRVGVQHRDLEGHYGKVPLRERHHPGGGDVHTLAGGGQPEQLAAQNPVTEVERAFVAEEVRFVQSQRFVVNIKPHDLAVGGVDHDLADLGETVCGFSVADFPGLVQPVHVGAVLMSSPPLDGIAAHTEVAIANREERLSDTECLCVVFGFDQAPGVNGKTVTVHCGALPRIYRIGMERERAVKIRSGERLCTRQDRQ